MVDVPIRTDNFKFSDPRYLKKLFSRGKSDVNTYWNGEGTWFPFSDGVQVTVDAKIGLGSIYRLPFTVKEPIVCKKADGTLSIVNSSQGCVSSSYLIFPFTKKLTAQSYALGACVDSAGEARILYKEGETFCEDHGYPQKRVLGYVEPEGSTPPFDISQVNITVEHTCQNNYFYCFKIKADRDIPNSLGFWVSSSVSQSGRIYTTFNTVIDARTMEMVLPESYNNYSYNKVFIAALDPKYKERPAIALYDWSTGKSSQSAAVDIRTDNFNIKDPRYQKFFRRIGRYYRAADHRDHLIYLSPEHRESVRDPEGTGYKYLENLGYTYAEDLGYVSKEPLPGMYWQTETCWYDSPAGNLKWDGRLSWQHPKSQCGYSDFPKLLNSGIYFYQSNLGNQYALTDRLNIYHDPVEDNYDAFFSPPGYGWVQKGELAWLLKLSNFEASPTPRPTPPPPTTIPTITSAGRGCDDKLCLSISGKNIYTNTVVDLHKAAGGYLATVTSDKITYYIKDGYLTIRVPTEHHARLRSEGLGVVLVNPAAPTPNWSNLVTVPKDSAPTPPPTPKPSPTPVPTTLPTITSAGRGCDDKLCLWISGKNIYTNTVVDLHKAAGGYLATVTSDKITYYIKDGYLTIRVPTEHHARLRSEGLGVVLVNPAAPTPNWSNWVTVPKD